MADNLAKHLKDRGYNAVALPTNAFLPLSLVFEYKSRRGWNNDFDHLVQEPEGTPPKLRDAGIVPDFSGKRTAKFEAKAALSILSGLIAGLGGGKLGIGGGYERASTVEFEYGEVTASEVSESALDDFLQTGMPPSKDRILGQYISDNLFIVTRVLQSREFKVVANSSDGTTLAIDVPVIQQMVGGSVSVGASGTRASVITYKGDVDVSFGFQCFKVALIKRDGENRMTIRPTKPGAVTTFGMAPKATADFEPALIEADEDGLVLPAGSAPASAGDPAE